MKNALHPFACFCRSAFGFWGLIVAACALLLVASNMLAIVISLICWILILNGLYHAILGIRSLLVRAFGDFGGAIRALIVNLRSS